MAFSRRHNGSSPVVDDEVPTVVVDTPIPDVWAQYEQRRRERVQNAEQKFSEMIGTQLYDPDDKAAFDGRIDAETADWSSEDIATHHKYRREIDERLAETENEVTRTEKKLAAAEEKLRAADQKMHDALLLLGGRPTPVPTTNEEGRAAGVTDPAAAPAGAQSAGRWADLVATHHLHNPRWTWLWWTLVVVAFGGDFAVFYVVLERLLRAHPFIVALAALAFAAIAVLLSHAIGQLWRRRDARDPGHSDTRLWVLLVAWILLGIAAASGRLFFGTPAASTAGGDGLAVLPAVLFFALYIGSGLCTMYLAHETYNPAATAYRLAVPLRDEAQREVERCAGMCSAARARKALIEKEDARADKRLKRAELVTRNEVVGIKHFVRHQMAGSTDSARGLALFMEDAPQPVKIPPEDDL